MSSTEREEPIRAMPYAERLDPSLANMRHDKPEPMWTKSKAEHEEPMRVIPYTEHELPNLANDRILSEDPRWL
jgi:hypothetical protein